jgi:hypothetical protein
MDLMNPFRRQDEGWKRDPPRPLGTGEWAKIYILGTVFAFSVLVMVSLKVFIDRMNAAAAKRAARGEVAARDDGPSRDNPRVAELARLVKPFDDGEGPVDPAAPYFQDLARFVADREIADLVDRRTNILRMQVDPDACRGNVARVAGTLASVPRDAKGPCEVVIDTDGTGPVHVWLPAVPALPDRSPVQAEAVFLRLITAPQPDTPGRPVLMAKALRPAAVDPQAAPRQPVEKLDPESVRKLAAEFRDGEDPVIKESQPFLSLLGVVHDATPAAVGALAAREPANPSQLLADPAKHRGEVVRIYGQLTTVKLERLEATIPQNLEAVYVGYMQSYPHGAQVHFYLPTWPEGVKLTPYSHKRGHQWYRDWIEVEGVFLRRYDYEGTPESEGQRGPRLNAVVLLARDLRLAAKPHIPDPRAGFISVVMAIAVVLGVVILALGIWSRKRSPHTLRMELAVRRRDPHKPRPGPAPEKQLLGDEVPTVSEAAPTAAPSAPTAPATPPAPPAAS